MSVSGRKLVRRACDGCKIRKIKCTEVTPCDGCVAAGIACTFIKQPSTRGPRRLRKSTLREITQSQQQWEDLGFGSSAPGEPVVHTKLDAESVFAPNKVAALVLQLCVYRLRMYPVWPIIKVERLVASLQKPEPDIEVFGLAYAVAAATIAQIRAKTSTQPGAVTAEMMEAQCQYAKARRNKDQPPDLTTVRIPFFLHMYYENLEPGGLQSITYLREAIAVAHMIGLHRETYYGDVQPEEREIRRRTLWLLFVAERNISISHKLPVTIRTKIAFPGTIDSDSEHVLAAYQKLVTMFWNFDRSGVFDLLDRSDYDFSKATAGTLPPGLAAALASMQKRLDEVSISVDNIEETQAFDLLVTRQWMRIILWRLIWIRNDTATNTIGGDIIRQPLQIANDLLNEIARTSETTIEAHSLVFETKIFEIATSIVDTVAQASFASDIDIGLAMVLHEVLMKLRRFLSRNEVLREKLRKCINGVCLESHLHSDINQALSAVVDEPLEDATVVSVETNNSQGISASSVSSTGALSASPTSLSPYSHWSTQQEYQSIPIETPSVTTTNMQSTLDQEILDEHYPDMDWSQYGYGHDIDVGFYGAHGDTWHDTNFIQSEP